LKNRFSNGFLSVVDIPSDTIQGVEACQGISLVFVLDPLAADGYSEDHVRLFGADLNRVRILLQPAKRMVF
jgi:hypothetical protein